MGTGGSSSKRKSSSVKKKRPKNPSEVRRKKKSSRRSRAKKLRRRVDSISNSDSDDSRSSVSYSSSSSEDDCRSRRSRSRTMRTVKGSKKRAETSSSSPESRRELPHPRKRKGSKKTVSSQARKKPYKMKPRRDASVSSASSESLRGKTHKKKPRRGMSVNSASCDSTSGKTHKKKPRRDISVSSGSSDSLSYSSCSEGEYERPRGRSKRKDRSKINDGKLKSEKWSRYRSRSSSSCSKHSNTSRYHSEERLIIETNSRRLRSVITFVKDPDEKDGSQLDRGEEEIIYDRDDYPCRSTDSIEGGNKREHANHLHVESEKRRKVENSIEVGKYNPPMENRCDEDPAVAGSPNAEDLESILRQRALENLRKFRGASQKHVKPPAQEKDKSDSDVKQLPNTNSELVRAKLPKEDGVNAAVGTNLVVKEAATYKTVYPADHVVSYKPKESMNATASVITKQEVNSIYASQNVNELLVKRNEVKSMAPRVDAVSGNPKEKDLTADVFSKNQVFSFKPKESVEATASVVAKTGIDSPCASQNVSKLMVKRNEVKSLIPKQDTVSPVDTVHVSGDPKEKNSTTGVITKTGADSVCSSPTVSRIPVKRCTIQSGIPKRDSTPLADQVTASISPKENMSGTSGVSNDKLELRKPALMQKVPTSLTSPKAAHSVANSTDKSLGSNNQGAEVNNTCDSSVSVPVPSLKPAWEESNIKESLAETKEASQFEQKTMSVMRGGERVQVSYKVYIPQKAPALARRQLKR